MNLTKFPPPLARPSSHRSPAWPPLSGASLALLAALALALLAACASIAGAASRGSVQEEPAKLLISKVAVQGKKVSVSGRVTLPPGTEAGRARVALSLISSSPRRVERFTAKVGGKGSFSASKRTTLTGRLTVGALVKIAGRQSGKAVKRSIVGPASKTAGKGKSASGGGGSAGGGSAGVPVGTPLVGLFSLEAGKQAVSGAMSGTYFRMYGVQNNNSPFADRNYTPLRPGVDGGLRTDIYQPAPSPAFAGVTVSGAPTGNALANRIVQPQAFFNEDFSIVTEPIDPQEGLPDPLPAIANDGGKLSGQITAWAAQWNGLSFNQGSPKANGSSPAGPQAPGGVAKVGVAGTTPLTGTYDPATRHFVLTWQSLIIGGPFNTFTGAWHLEGTFVPTP